MALIMSYTSKNIVATISYLVITFCLFSNYYTILL